MERVVNSIWSLVDPLWRVLPLPSLLSICQQTRAPLCYAHDKLSAVEKNGHDACSEFDATKVVEVGI